MTKLDFRYIINGKLVKKYHTIWLSSEPAENVQLVMNLPLSLRSPQKRKLSIVHLNDPFTTFTCLQVKPQN